ncbi:MAG: hypothetical protein ACYTG6_10920 [Planctomycetota bacterium]|jgi:hypothetical protein
MRHTITLTCICILAGASALGQPPAFDPDRLDTPDQFYTNGMRIDAWNRDEGRKQIVTFWFGKNPADSFHYQQLLAISRDEEPDKIYYFEYVGRKFVGRYDMEEEGYSLLKPEHRLEHLEQIREEWFPPPGETPAIGDLFDPPREGEPNRDRLMMPPVTMMFPRLQRSEWEGFYTDQSCRRHRMTLRFRGDEGEYEAPEAGTRGDLTNVRYMPQDGMIMIQGTWSAGDGRRSQGRRGSSGRFEFPIMMMDLNRFQGRYWFGNDGPFLWDGRRTSR